MKTISVVMCASNAEDTIAGSIESVLKQSYPDFELIIVNNGSTDNTKAIINSYDDERIRIIDNIDKNYSEFFAFGATIHNQYFEYASQDFRESTYSQYRYYESLYYNLYY